MLLKRNILIDIVDEFNKQYKLETDEQVKVKLISNVLNDLKNTLDAYSYEHDDRFVTYCRRDFLRKEFTFRLNKGNIESYKDYLIEAYFDLYDYIVCDTWISLASVPKNKSAEDVIKKSDEYKEDGIICKQEKGILLDMIYEFQDIIKKDYGIEANNNSIKETQKGMKIFIKEYSWSGWTRDYVPEMIYHEYEIKLNKKYVVKIQEISNHKKFELFRKIREDFSFIIKEIGENYIVINTNVPMSNELGNGINLNTKEIKFKIKLDEVTKLVTPTTDMGYIYEISLRR